MALSEAVKKRIRDTFGIDIEDQLAAEEMIAAVDGGGGGSSRVVHTFTGADLAAASTEAHPDSARKIARLPITAAVPAGKQLLSIIIKIDEYFGFVEPAESDAFVGGVFKVAIPGHVNQQGGGGLLQSAYIAHAADLQYMPPLSSVSYNRVAAANIQGDQAGLPYNQINGTLTDYYGAINNSGVDINLEAYFELINNFSPPPPDFADAIDPSKGIIKVILELADAPAEIA